MPCDERYRSWAVEQAGKEAPAPELMPAVLVRVSLCPASAGCQELHFDVGGVPWSWCFPPADSTPVPPDTALVLRPGPHGLIAEGHSSHAAGAPCTATRLDLATAAALALSAYPVFVHRSLVSLPSAVTA